MLSQQAWLRPFQATFESLRAASDWITYANQLLEQRRANGELLLSGGHTALSFRVSDLTEPLAYEPGIFTTGQVPCRTVAGGFSNAQEQHDFYNALMWLSFPKSKARLNQLSMAAIEAVKNGLSSRRSNRSESQRGILRDAITVFDESSLLLLCSDIQLVDLLAARRWQTLLVAHRLRWVQSDGIVPICFGHALLQKLESPFKAITGHCFVISVEAGLQLGDYSLDRIDNILSDNLTPDVLTKKPFLPLPVLGIPKWSPENIEPSFYDDVRVFRPAKSDNSHVVVSKNTF